MKSFLSVQNDAERQKVTMKHSDHSSLCSFIFFSVFSWVEYYRRRIKWRKTHVWSKSKSRIRVTLEVLRLCRTLEGKIQLKRAFECNETFYERNYYKVQHISAMFISLSHSHFINESLFCYFAVQCLLNICINICYESKKKNEHHKNRNLFISFVTIEWKKEWKR